MSDAYTDLLICEYADCEELSRNDDSVPHVIHNMLLNIQKIMNPLISNGGLLLQRLDLHQSCSF